MTFDPTITASGVLVILSNIALGLIYLIRMEGKMNVFGMRITSLEAAIEQLAHTDRRIGVLEERLSNHVKMLTTAQQDIQDLRRGKGFIQRRGDDGESGIDGRYP
jgi:hypothetical protein